MHNSAHDEYLVTQVMTATPQKLHLMLLDAALRHCDQARRHFEASQVDQAEASLVRAQDIVTELLASLNYSEHRDLAGRIAAEYNFVYRALVTAHLRHDPSNLANAVRVLEVERETWRELAQRTPAATPSPSAAAPAAAPAPSHAAHTSHPIPAPVSLTEAPTARLSLEA